MFGRIATGVNPELLQITPPRTVIQHADTDDAIASDAMADPSPLRARIATRYVPRTKRACALVASALALAAIVLLGGCTKPEAVRPQRQPAEVRIQILRNIPQSTMDRDAWATDIYGAFAALQFDVSVRNICAALAVTAQESSFDADPVVPGLGRIAREEIDRRAERHHIPQLLVKGALLLKSPDGRSYGDRLDSVRTERELSLIFEDLIGSVPLGKQLFADANPVRTGGPMQVSILFAEQHAQDHRYPYPIGNSIRDEVFTRRGGLYFGIAHLLGYPVSYDQMLFRFADYNAGFYASRNAAFQKAVSLTSGIPLALDGDLIRYDDSEIGATERAARTLGHRIELSDLDIHSALEQGESIDFERTELYRRVFALADQTAHAPQPRTLLPRIALESPKITRKLTTEWFANRVEQRYRTCLDKGS